MTSPAMLSRVDHLAYATAGLQLTVQEGPGQALLAAIDCPNGRVVLR